MSTDDLTYYEQFLLHWLLNDYGAYGECRGPTLDALLQRGLVKLGPVPPGKDEDYRTVTLTETGVALAKEKGKP